MTQKFGGEIRFTLSGGRTLVLRAAGNLSPAGFSSESIVNQDGSLSKVGTLTAKRLETTYEDAAGLDWDALMRETEIDASAVEDYTGVTHLYTRGHFDGEPQIDRANGEVSGVIFVTRQYRRVG